MTTFNIPFRMRQRFNPIRSRPKRSYDDLYILADDELDQFNSNPELDRFAGARESLTTDGASRRRATLDD